MRNWRFVCCWPPREEGECSHRHLETDILLRTVYDVSFLQLISLVLKIEVLYQNGLNELWQWNTLGKFSFGYTLPRLRLCRMSRWVNVDKEYIFETLISCCIQLFLDFWNTLKIRTGNIYLNINAQYRMKSLDIKPFYWVSTWSNRGFSCDVISSHFYKSFILATAMLVSFYHGTV